MFKKAKFIRISDVAVELTDNRRGTPEIFANRTLSDEINYEMSDQETQIIIRRKI